MPRDGGDKSMLSLSKLLTLEVEFQTESNGKLSLCFAVNYLSLIPVFLAFLCPPFAHYICIQGLAPNFGTNAFIRQVLVVVAAIVP